MALTMRQETGSSNTPQEKRISVKLSAGGDLFVIDELEAELAAMDVEARGVKDTEASGAKDTEASGEKDAEASGARAKVRVELLTKRVMLIPAERLLTNVEAQESESVSMEVVREELSRGGISYYEDEAVVTMRSGDRVALVVVPKAMLRLLDETCGVDGVAYEVPILRRAVGEERHLIVDSVRGVTTILMYDRGGELTFADVYETPTDASAIYWVQRVAKAVEMREEIYLYICRCSGTMRRLLQRDFKKMMICE